MINPKNPYLNKKEKGNKCMLCIADLPNKAELTTPVSLKEYPSKVAPMPPPKKKFIGLENQKDNTRLASSIRCCKESMEGEFQLAFPLKIKYI